MGKVSCLVNALIDRLSHIKEGADVMTTTGDMALTAELATVAIEGRDPGESGGLSVGQGSKFWHESNQGSGREGADAPDLLKTLHLGIETR